MISQTTSWPQARESPFDKCAFHVSIRPSHKRWAMSLHLGRVSQATRHPVRALTGLPWAQPPRLVCIQNSPYGSGSLPPPKLAASMLSGKQSSTGQTLIQHLLWEGPVQLMVGVQSWMELTQARRFWGWTLEPDKLSPNPDSATQKLCNSAQVTQPL